MDYGPIIEDLHSEGIRLSEELGEIKAAIRAVAKLQRGVSASDVANSLIEQATESNGGSTEVKPQSAPSETKVQEDGDSTPNVPDRVRNLLHNCATPMTPPDIALAIREESDSPRLLNGVNSALRRGIKNGLVRRYEDGRYGSIPAYQKAAV